MLARDENERVTRVGRGTPMGEAMRRDVGPAPLTGGAAVPDCPAEPAQLRRVSKVIQESNWLQGLEGGIDTSHVPILHRTLTSDSSRPGFKPGDPFVVGKAPTLELDIMDYGYRYAGLRPLADGETHIRAYHFILPFHQIRPARTGSGSRGFSGAAGHLWGPLGGESTLGCDL